MQPSNYPTSQLPDYLPLSMLNAFEYCQRRFWIEFVNGEMEVNAHVLEGQIKHQRAHAGGVEQTDDELTLRRLYVYSDRLRVAGFVHLVQTEERRVVPVEYKKGSMGKWLNDHIQLCAQTLCLEERLEAGDWKLDQAFNLQSPVSNLPYGYIFYFGSRHREQVDFDAALRAQTIASVERMWKLLSEDKMPAPIEQFAKCRECSLEPICLPREVRQLVG
jgi:CRISPR-associated exonuclease Cas4